MNLEEYFEKKCVNKRAFQRNHGIDQMTIRRAILKMPISMRTAKKIVDATEGVVTYEDLISDDD